MTTSLTNLRVAIWILAFGLIVTLIKRSDGHGRLMNPVARGSRWRFNSSAPADYNDNEGFCGGYTVQWQTHNGKCGLCGNNYGDETPRNHELGGKFGEGIIVKLYEAGSAIEFSVLLTANHRGSFYFNLCNLDNNEESEDCFREIPLELQSGGYTYYLPTFTSNTWYNDTLVLPFGLTCDHCVFRWTYDTANTWGLCEDGSHAVGCGPQETFKGCSDISIN